MRIVGGMSVNPSRYREGPLALSLRHERMGQAIHPIVWSLGAVHLLAPHEPYSGRGGPS
jgi:hypothetical protein